MNMKPPMSPTPRSTREMVRSREDRRKPRGNEVSSVESSTEGDSSQQSQRSIVYLHAATGTCYLNKATRTYLIPNIILPNAMLAIAYRQTR